MATYNYKYLFTNDPDVTVNQSRGFSLQYNGFALISSPKLHEHITDESLDLNQLIEDGYATILFRDISYMGGSPARSRDSGAYEAALKKPGLHMFQGINAVASDEFKMASGEGEDNEQRASFTVNLSIYDTMFGDRLTGEVAVDGIVLYGQAYNPDFLSDAPQGSIERSVPIGVIVFDGQQKPTIDPSSDGKNRVDLSLLLNFSTSDITGRIVKEDDASYKEWSKLAKHFHVVNNNLTTDGKFVLKDRKMVPAECDNMDIDSDAVVDVRSRLFFTNDVMGSNYDRNVDFGSPAKLTILSMSSAYNDDSVPQKVIGNVDYYEDENHYLHSRVEGVVENFFNYSGYSNNRVKEGPVYYQDWFAQTKPAISLYSNDTEYIFAEPNFGAYLRHASPTSTADSYDNANYEANSACFANGNNLFTSCSTAVGDGTNINTYKVVSRGNNFILNSSNVRAFSRSMTDAETEDNKKFRYNTFVANSKDIAVYGRVKGSASNSDRQKKRGPSNDLNTVLNSVDVSIDNRSAGYFLANTEEFGRNTIIEANRVNIVNGDHNLVLGVKGWSQVPDDGYSKLPVYSEISNTKNSVFLGGNVKSNCGFANVVIGLASDFSVQGRDDTGLANVIDGIPEAELSSGNRDSDILYRVRNSFILGLNCHISAYRYKNPWDSSSTPALMKDEEQYVFMVGKGLRNDLRQSYNCKQGEFTTTLILGNNNNDYYQPNQVKQIVVGGYFPLSSGISEFKYNSLEHTIAKSVMAPRSSYEETMYNRESILTLTDVKGRTIDYGSEAINLGFIKGGRSTGNYANYNFVGCGRINLFKLYKLLDRLQWEWNETLQKSIVVFRSGAEIGAEATIPGSQWPTPWSDYGFDDTNSQSSTTFSRLVDDSYATWPFYPMAKNDD